MEAASGLVLLLATALALLWTNSSWSSAYAALWGSPLTVGFGGSIRETTPRLLVKEGLMSVLFLLIGLELRRGWAIPTATDIAFAIGVLTLLGRRIPAAVRVLLLALAVIDDVAAVIIIAVFYSAGLHWGGLVRATAGLGIVLLLQRFAIRSGLPYLLSGAPASSGMIIGLESGLVVGHVQVLLGRA